MAKSKPQSNTKPEKVFRIGSVSAAVFVNEPESGRTFRSVALQRSYRDGDETKYATSFRLSDLPNAIAVLQMAMNHVAAEEADPTV